MKKHIITIAGKPGSGKSTTANLLAQTLGYERYSSGDFMRTIAMNHHMTLAELGEYAKTHPEIDLEIDAENVKAGTKDNIVIDARLAFHFIPESYKVYLDLDLVQSASRIYHNQTEARVQSGESPSSEKELETMLRERLESERERYTTLYGINHLDLSNYDLVINTEKLSTEEIVDQIIHGYNSFIEKE
jgi:cytidylate kinase